MIRAPLTPIGWAVLLTAAPCWAAPPILYSSAAYQSPVRADPDDLLLLPGYGFSRGDTVVYRAIADTSRSPTPPTSIPAKSTDALGVADIVSVADAPYSLTVHLPSAVKTDQSYAIWVVNSALEWSNATKINDARPLWITPDEVFASAAPAGMPRVLKVVGRNLQPATGSSTQVRLVGAHATYTLPAVLGEDRLRTIDRYVARIQLPADMAVGTYSVQVSRDGVGWVGLLSKDSTSTQTLTVSADPAVPMQFQVGDYSLGACDSAADGCSAVRRPCLPDAKDNDDETLCIASAIAAARAAGGGVVKFAAGSWNMNSPGTWAPGQRYSSRGVSHDGLVVPDGVSLQGAGSSATVVVRGSAWDLRLPTFVLRGHNTVTRFTFRDARVYQTKEWGAAFLMLGGTPEPASSTHRSAPSTISHITIANNTFDKPFIAIGNDGLAIDHLFVTNNVFGAYMRALFWEGNASNTHFRYRYSDSVVARNTFFPGSYLDSSIGQGTIATEVSGGYRIDFSENVADGTSAAYLYHPEVDAKGWRAAHFWSMHDNVEMLLVSQNSATCTGDKDGDGEAMSYDSNHNRPDFMTLEVPVLTATSDPTAATSTVSVNGALIETQMAYGRAINVNPVTNYYVGDWLQIVRGPGIGQARKITAIRTGSSADPKTVTFTVAPAFDVLPQTNSTLIGGRMYWQTYTVDNVIDQRTPLCLKSNRTRHAGGSITLYGPTTDSVVEGNRQYDASGILLGHQFELVDAAAGVGFPSVFVDSFNEIRDNLVSGTYDERDSTPQAEYGIAGIFAATPNTAPPPTMSYGLAISHNVVSGSSGSKGAISLSPSWYTGPKSRIFGSSTPWRMADATLLFNNTLSDIGQHGAKRVGIGLSADNSVTPIEWHTALYGNVCHLSSPQQSLGLVDLGTQTVRYCPSAGPSAGNDSCDCQGPPTDLGLTSLTGDQAPVSGAVGSAVTYAMLVANNGPATATGATFSVVSPAELTINSMSGAGIACDTVDPGVELCHLGNLASGASVRINIVATISAAGPAKTLFTVAHKESDTNISNDSVAVVTVGAGP
jgi:uncharacterized repeat protein (TIGR01451 family)